MTRGRLLKKFLVLKNEPLFYRAYAIKKRNVKIQKRGTFMNKYDFGKIVIIGGSETMPGAPLISYLSAKTALKGGAGLCVLAVPENAKAAYMSRVTEEMLAFLPCNSGGIVFDAAALEKNILKADAVVIGSGMPPDEELLKTIEYLSANFNGTLVLDAGALTALAKNPDAVKNHKCRLILTPHAGEFDRMKTAAGISGGFLSSIKQLSKMLDAVIVHKEAVTAIVYNDEVLFNTRGTPAMAKGGTGDALAGLAGALALKNNPFQAAAAASFFLGKAGEYAGKKLGTESVLASDIISCIKI